ncbi:MAG: dTDP-4-dehydrorhamnose 3,5-epimerase [Ferruginibacter sp.]
MPFISTDLPGLLIFEPAIFNDSRGYFYESYNEALFKKAGIEIRFVQDNQAKSSYGVIRGLHYQSDPHSQTKLVRALQGSILDVVVDMRKNSPSFGKSYSIELTSENKKQLLVPQGFAHGYSVLSETAEVFYKCDNFWNKEAEGGVLYNDPHLNIDWRIPSNKAVISEKDLVYPLFKNTSSSFLYN